MSSHNSRSHNRKVSDCDCKTTMPDHVSPKYPASMCRLYAGTFSSPSATQSQHSGCQTSRLHQCHITIECSTYSARHVNVGTHCRNTTMARFPFAPENRWIESALLSTAFHYLPHSHIGCAHSLCVGCNGQGGRSNKSATGNFTPRAHLRQSLEALN